MNRLAVLVSGNGTNLQAIIDACADGRLPESQVAVVVSNHREAYALERARLHGISTLYHPFYPYRRDGLPRSQYDADLAVLIKPFSPDVIVLAGWMHILGMEFLRHYPNRVLNIHPALPGTFPGTHAIERAYEAYQNGEITHTGVMVHLAPDDGVDVGPVVAQCVVPIYTGESLAQLEERVHRAEHDLYITAIKQLLAQLG